MSTPRGGWRRGSRVSNGHAATSTHPPRGGRLKEPLLSHRAKTLERAQEASAHDDLCRSPMMQIPQVAAFVCFCPSSLQVSTRTTRRGGGAAQCTATETAAPGLQTWAVTRRQRGARQPTLRARRARTPVQGGQGRPAQPGAQQPKHGKPDPPPYARE